MAEQKEEAAKKTNSRIRSAKKRDKQNVKRRTRNRSFKSEVKTAINQFEASLAKGDKASMQQNLNSVFSLMDKGIKTGRYKLNKVARTKSRLTKKVSS